MKKAIGMLNKSIYYDNTLSEAYILKHREFWKEMKMSILKYLEIILFQ